MICAAPRKYRSAENSRNPLRGKGIFRAVKDTHGHKPELYALTMSRRITATTTRPPQGAQIPRSRSDASHTPPPAGCSPRVTTFPHTPDGAGVERRVAINHRSTYLDAPHITVAKGRRARQ